MHHIVLICYILLLLHFLTKENTEGATSDDDFKEKVKN